MHVRMLKGVGVGEKETRYLDSFFSLDLRTFLHACIACTLADCQIERENNICVQAKRALHLASL